MKYYIASNGQPEGPYTIEELASRNISQDTLVWNETYTNWIPAGNVDELRQSLFSNQAFNGPQPPIYAPGSYIPPQTPNYGYQQPINLCPKTWLVESILVTLFCCMPFGIVGIIKASSVESKFRAGDYVGALEASKSAGHWTKLGFFISIIVYILYFLFFGMALLGAAGNTVF